MEIHKNSIFFKAFRISGIARKQPVFLRYMITEKKTIYLYLVDYFRRLSQQYMEKKYLKPCIEVEELLPCLLICDSQTDGELIDVIDEPMFT